MNYSQYMESRKHYDAIREREEKALIHHWDCADRPIKVGDKVAYALSLGRSAGMQIGEVVNINEHGHLRIRIDERFRKSWGTKPEVTVQYSDRMVILKELDDTTGST